MSDPASLYPHGLRRMLARDPTEPHRAASPLELFFDLTFVSAFLVIGSELARGIASGRAGSAVIAACIALVATVWAWTAHAWFASAFDNDDWLFRVLTLIQMGGVIVLAIGVPDLFAGIAEGDHLGKVMVAGYVVMRVAVIGQWVRVAVDDGDHRRLALGHACVVGVAQIGWVVVIMLPLPMTTLLLVLAAWWIVDLAGPTLINHRHRRATGASMPWHPHHLAERYTLLVVIAIGETVIGTVQAGGQISGVHGWTADAVLAIAVGICVSFSLWWAYFQLPSSQVLTVRREKVSPWAYGHIVLSAAIVCTGAGIHLLGYYFDPGYQVPTWVSVVAIALPVWIAQLMLFGIHGWLLSAPPHHRVHVWAALAPPIAVGLSVAGAPLWVSLVVVLASPLSVVFGHELGEWRRLSAQLQRVLSGGARRR